MELDSYVQGMASVCPRCFWRIIRIALFRDAPCPQRGPAFDSRTNAEPLCKMAGICLPGWLGLGGEVVVKRVPVDFGGLHAAAAGDSCDLLGVLGVVNHRHAPFVDRVEVVTRCVLCRRSGSKLASS